MSQRFSRELKNYAGTEVEGWNEFAETVKNKLIKINKNFLLYFNNLLIIKMKKLNRALIFIYSKLLSATSIPKLRLEVSLELVLLSNHKLYC